MQDEASLVSKNLSESIEMAYWLVKFVGDHDRKNEYSASLLNPQVASTVKFARYLVKFVRSFEKLT